MLIGVWNELLDVCGKAVPIHSRKIFAASTASVAAGF